MEQETFLSFLHILEKLKCNTRHSRTTSGREESVAEHSWRLAVMAYLLREEFPGLDMVKVMEMCLVHDFGEAVTGDIPSFEKDEEDERTEAGAVSMMLKALPPVQRKRLADLFREIGEQNIQEAKLFAALDKLEALVQHNEADISTWIPLEYELNLTYGTEEAAAFPYTNGLRNLLREISRKKIEKKQQETGEK